MRESLVSEASGAPALATRGSASVLSHPCRSTLLSIYRTPAGATSCWAVYRNCCVVISRRPRLRAGVESHGAGTLNACVYTPAFPLGGQHSTLYLVTVSWPARSNSWGQSPSQQRQHAAQIRLLPATSRLRHVPRMPAWPRRGISSSPKAISRASRKIYLRHEIGSSITESLRHLPARSLRDRVLRHWELEVFK